MPDQATNTTFRDYMRILFRQKAIIITTFVTVMVTITIALMLKTPVYEATVKMLVSAEKQVESPYYREMVDSQSSEAIATQAEIVKSDPILDRTVRALGLYEMPFDYESRFCSPLKSYFVKLRVKMLNTKLGRLIPKDQKGFLYRMAIDHLRDSISIEPIHDTNMFLIKVRDFSGYGAAVLANVVSRSYVIFDLEQQVAELQLKYGEKHLAVTQLKDNISKMEKSLNGEPVTNIEAIGPASVKIIEQAQIPIEPTGAPKKLIMILAFFMSIFLGTTLAFVFEYSDQTIKQPNDIETQLNVPFLGAIPKMKFRGTVLAWDSPKLRIKSRFLGAFRDLSDQLRLMIKNQKIKTLLIVGPDIKEGTTTIIANLAAYLAHQKMLKVLIIDANFRDAGIHKAFKLKQSPGIANLLCEKVNFDEVVQKINPHLSILSTGTTHINPITFMDSSNMHELIIEAKNKFDIVLIDCSDLKGYKDSIILSSMVDGVIMLIAENKTRRQAIERILSLLKEHKTNLIGAILNKRTFVIPKFVYERV